MALFRAGHDEAFRVIHDRYRQRLFAYTRQMLPRRQDAEDALQDIFVRAYSGLRANDRELALRAWLYRVAHNRCIDELRRPAPPPPEVIELLRSPVHDPIAEADRRESLRRLIADVRRLPDQQRSALLMRELGGMSYADMAAALGVTVPAVKSLLVRARLALAQALEARDTACSEIREELILAHDRGLRPNATARRHMRDCAGCREFRHDLRGVSRRFAAIVPTLGPIGVLANMLGVGGAGGGAAGTAAGGAVAVGGVAGGGTAIVSVGAMSAGATHVAALLAAAVVTAGGAVELQHTLPAAHHHHHHARPAASAPPSHPAPAPAPAPIAPIAPASYSPPAAQAPVVAAAAPVRVTPAGRTSAQGSGSATSVTTLSSTTISPVKVKSKATGGISTVNSPGGVAPSDRAAGTAKRTTGSSPSSSSSSSSVTSGAAQPTQQPSDGATSSTQSASTTPSQPTSSTTGTDTSPGSTTGTGATPGAGTGQSPPPTQ